MVMLALTSFVESTGNEKLPLLAVMVLLLVPSCDERTTWIGHSSNTESWVKMLRVSRRVKHHNSVVITQVEQPGNPR